jgi:diguanylate cyclase (GGDEF)-like protein
MASGVHRAILALLVLLTLPCFAPAAPAPPTTQSAVQALEAERNADPAATLARLERELAAPPADRDPRLLAHQYRMRAEILRERGDLVAARRDAAEFARRAKALGDRPLVASALMLSGSLDAEDNQIADALFQFHEARTLLEGSPHLGELSRAYNAIGVAYNFILDYANARRYYEKSLQLARQAEDASAELRALGNLALTVSELDGAAAGLPVHREALELSVAAGDVHGEALQLGNICQRLHQIGNLEAARDTCANAFERLSILGLKRPRAGVRMTLGDIERGAGQLDAALAYYEAALADSEGVVPGVEIAVREALSDVREQRADPVGALRELRAWARLRADLSERERQSAVAELEVRYQVAQRQRELELLKLDAELSDARLRRRTLLLAAVAVALALASLAAALGWRGYRTQKRLEGTLAARNQALEHALQTIGELASVDMLTGLLNRRAFEEQAQRELTRVQRSGEAVTLALVDIDHFKELNDRYGHLRGDQALKTVAEVMRSCLRTTDLACRWGGEEFLCLLVGSDPSAAARAIDRVRAELAAHPALTGIEPAVTITAGVAGVHGDLQSALQKADVALYAGKNGGRDRVVVQH